MKTKFFWILLATTFLAEFFLLFTFGAGKGENCQDPVAVNEVVQSVLKDWDHMETHQSRSGLDYVVLDNQEELVFATRRGLRENLHEAVRYWDTILDLMRDGVPVGKVIIQNPQERLLRSRRQQIVRFLMAALLLQAAVCIGYGIYWNRVLIRPFEKLRAFARRIAAGNLDVPLTMDRQNIFGAFTESFDLMRTELKRAQIAEAEASAGKKELIANLSHDIKTPVASIKAAAEVGAALARDEKNRDNYGQIIQKADQINTLVTNLFTSALEELSQLAVAPTELGSGEVKALLQNADYQKRASLPEFPPCLVAADRLRLQQVFDNLFTNSYKYAGTPITVSVSQRDRRLEIVLADSGGGVSEEELPFLKKKFWRGKDAGGLEGAGLGLYLSDYFMEKMGGELHLANGEHGLAATVVLKYI